MADIDIVPKHRSYLWLWIVIALIILAVLWYVLAGNGTPGNGTLGTPQTLLAPAAAAFGLG
jgi:hypothetical protein